MQQATRIPIHLDISGGTALVESFNACLLVAGSLDESTVSFWDIRSPLPIGHVSTKVKSKDIQSHLTKKLFEVSAPDLSAFCTKRVFCDAEHESKFKQYKCANVRAENVKPVICKDR